MGRPLYAVAALAVLFLGGLWASFISRHGKPAVKELAAPAPLVIKAERDLQYGPHGVGNRLDLFRAERAVGPLPLIVWIHGGGWAAGSKDNGYPTRLLGEGYAVAAVNYRLSDEAKFPAQIEDCKAAVRFLRANAEKYQLDPNHFGVWGASAGGHLAALLGTSAGVKELEGDGPNQDVSSGVQAVVDWYGPTDLLQWRGQLKNLDVVDPDKKDSVVGLLFGGSIQRHKELAEKANPIHYITKDAPPFFIMHGDADDTVPLGQSLLLDKALRAAGVDSTLVVLPGYGHGGPGFEDPKNQQKVLDFLDRRLLPADAPAP